MEAAPDSKPGEEPVSITVDETADAQPSPSDLAEHQRWGEDRIRRRLLNEYERAGKALSEMVNDNLQTPLRLSAVRILGAKHTRTGFLARAVSPYLGEDESTEQTLRHVLQKTRHITDRLERLGIFSEIEAGLESSNDALADGQDVDLVVKVKEGSRYFLKTATDVGDGEGSASATARLRNVFGGPETLEGNASFGTKTKSAFQIRFTAPILANPDLLVGINGFAIERDLSHFASCKERLRGARISLKTLSALGQHEFAYDGVMRNLCDVGANASMTIRNSAGLSVKSALSHTYLRDTRDDPFIATTGSYLRLMQEYAGLGGDSNFVKAEGETQLSRPVGAGCTASFAFRGGVLCPLGGQPSHILDRFHLGGPTSVRMFNVNGLGPRDNNDFVGGDLQWAAGLSLITPIPKREEWPLKGHFFVNAGRLVGYEQSIPQSFGNLFSQPSVSAGVGLMYKHSIVRLEMNLGMPIAAHKSDGVRKGLQFGLGLHFL